jgi:hypothetical protein
MVSFNDVHRFFCNPDAAEQPKQNASDLAKKYVDHIADPQNVCFEKN